MPRLSNHRPPRILLLLLLPAFLAFAASPALADGVVGELEPGADPNVPNTDALGLGEGGGGGGGGGGGSSNEGDPDDPLDHLEPPIARIIESVVLTAMMGL